MKEIFVEKAETINPMPERTIERGETVAEKVAGFSEAVI
jgi:hypothetical protein